MSIGFAIALFSLGATREMLGSGTLFEFPVFGPNFEPWVIMVLPPGGFLMLGVILLAACGGGDDGKGLYGPAILHHPSLRLAFQVPKGL